MKRFLPLLLVFVLTMALATPALAAGKANPPFALVGTITALDPANQTVTVQVVRGNTLVKAHIGQAVTLATTPATKFRLTDGEKTTIIKFADLKIGDAVSATGRLVNNTWTSSRITAGAKLDCLK